MNKRHLHLLLMLGLTFFTHDRFAQAQEVLNEVALFNRCYAHLTQLRPAQSDPLLAQVKAGSKSALQACTEILDLASFSAAAGTQIADANNTVAKAVLNSLHQLHRSWAREQNLFNLTDTLEDIGTEAWYEDSPFGAYVTRALFAPNQDVRSVVQGNEFLQPVRSNMAPSPSYRGVPNTTVGSETEFRLGAQQPFAPRGQLLGIRSVNIPPIDFFPPVRLTGQLPDFANIGVPPAATQALSNVNMADITAVRGPLTETTNFAIQIKGQILISTPATYRFYLNVDDGGALFVNQNRIINRSGSGESFADLTLSSGTYPIEIQFRQAASAARLIFSWQSPSITKQAVPASALSGLIANYYTEIRPAPIRLTGHEGGGFMGNHNYFLTTFLQADRNYVPNGADLINRSWARSVLNDALCRGVPVVRESDVEQFVIPNSNVPFRQAAACSACHASLDRQAGLIRGLRWNPLLTETNTSPTPTLIGIIGMNLLAPSLPLATTWSDVPDNEYGKKQPYGVFYFRNYKGELIDRPVNSIENLGSVISEQDDYYTCFAKRYYYYFLGIDVELGDPGNVLYPQLNGADQYHRSKVIDLGLRLKNHKSLRQLILDIIASADYRLSDFGISNQGSTP